MAYSQTVVVLGGLVHVPIAIAQFWMFDKRMSKAYMARKAAEAEVAAKAKAEAEAEAAAKAAADKAKAAAEKTAKAKAEASQASET